MGIDMVTEGAEFSWSGHDYIVRSVSDSKRFRSILTYCGVRFNLDILIKNGVKFKKNLNFNDFDVTDFEVVR